MGFLDTLKNAWNKVTSIFKSDKDEKEEQATPTTTPTSTSVANTTVKNDIIKDTTPIVPNATGTKTLDNLAGGIEKAQAVETTLPQAPTNYGNLSSIENIDTKLNAEIQKREEEKKESLRDYLGKKAKSAWHAVTHPAETFSKQMADTEYQANEKFFNIYYNPETKNLSQLTVSNEDLVDGSSSITKSQLYDRLTTDYVNTIYSLGDDTSDDVKNQLNRNYIDSVKGLFSVKEDDWYSDGIFFGDYLGEDGLSKKVGRRFQKFTKEQLDALSKLPKVEEGNYVPSDSQVMGYLQTWIDNNNTKKDVNGKYGVEQQEEGLDLGITPKGEAQELFFNRTMNGVMELANKNLTGENISEAVQNAWTIGNDTFNRAWTYAYPVFIEAEIVRQRQRNGETLTANDNKILDGANKLNLALDALSSGVNDFILENLDESNVVNGAILDNIETFSGGRSLWDVISKGVIEATGTEPAPGIALNRYSWLDAIQDLSNQTMKIAEGEYAGSLKRGWMEFEDATSNIGRRGSEIGQLTVGGFMRAHGALVNTVEGFQKGGISGGVNTISDYISGKRDTSKTATFLDQDFTIGRMINTEENTIFGQTASRTIKKYLMRAAEYVPEAAGNLIPDIIAIGATGGVGLVPTIGSKLGKVTKVADYVTKLDKLNDAKKAIEGVTTISKLNKGVAGMSNAIKTVTSNSKIPTSVRIGAQRFGRLLEEGTIGQLIDAQYSPYDSEAYSDASFALSMFGSALGDMLPAIKQAGAFRIAGNIPTSLLRRDSSELLRGTVWDTVNFFNNPSNADALDSIAMNLYGKGASSLNFNDYKKLQNSLSDLEDIAKDYWKRLPDSAKAGATRWTKQVMDNILSQTLNLDSNSTIARGVRALITNEKTNPADLIKYVGKISGIVEAGPWTSTIRLKKGLGEGAQVLGYAKAGDTGYSSALDIAVQGGFSNKLKNGFTIQDIDNIKNTPGYSNISENLFTKSDDGLYYITKKGLDAFNISYSEMPKELIAREINKADAGNIANTFRENLKGLKSSARDISDTTIDKVAESGTYQEVRDKVADIVC